MLALFQKYEKLTYVYRANITKCVIIEGESIGYQDVLSAQRREAAVFVQRWFPFPVWRQPFL